LLTDMPPALAQVLRRALTTDDEKLREEILRAAACDMSIRVAAETLSIALDQRYSYMYNEVLRLQSIVDPISDEAIAALVGAGWQFDE